MSDEASRPQPDARFVLGTPDTTPSSVKVPRPVTLNDRILAVIEILACAGVLSGDLAKFLLMPFLPANLTLDKLLERPKIVVGFMFLESFLLLVLIAFFQTQVRGQRLRDLGFKWRSVTKNIMLGLLTVPALFLISNLVGLYFKAFLPEYATTKNPLMDGIKTPGDLALFLLAGVFVGGFKEEVQRAFILLRFERYLFGAPLGLLAWSIIFGAGHYAQGFQVTIITGILGFCFGLLFLWRRNLIGPIIAHAGFDVMSLLLFWFFGRTS